MKATPSLPAKIFLVALLNIVLLALVLIIFARLQFRFDLSSFLLTPARERIVSVSRLIALQLFETPNSAWPQLLKQFEARYPAHFYLFAEDGTELAGTPVTLPATLLSRLPHLPPRMHDRQPPPAPAASAEAPGPPPEPPPPPPAGFEHRPGHEGGIAIIKAGSSAYWAAVHVPVWSPGHTHPSRAVLVWQFFGLWTDPFFFDYRPWLLGISIVLLLSAICWLPLVRGITNSISNLTTATARIANGHFNTEVRVTRRDELGRLSESINRMAKRLAGYVYGQKRFLGDVAHELSSPVARMQMALGVLEQRAHGEDAAFLADLREDLEQMSELVSELLSFSKAQVMQGAVELSPVNVSAIVRRALDRESFQDTQFELKVSDRLYALAHPELLRRGLANVMRNAIRYAGGAGAIEIAAVQVNDRVQIVVADHGPGIPESELENVFRPFYRPEFARTRETGGTGLGLAIVRDCVELCGGRVACRNRSPHGLEVTIELAVAAQPEAQSQELLQNSSSLPA